MGYTIVEYRVRFMTTVAVIPNAAVAQIDLWSASPTGEKFRGMLEFYNEGTPLQPSSTDMWTGFITLRFHLPLLQPIMQMLREEKPIILDSGLLSTFFEPVGEEGG
jgi:hypothetical protein